MQVTSEMQKVAPHSKDAEMMVIGSMITSQQALKIACEELRVTDFFFPEHKTIFNSIRDAYTKGRSIDAHLVCEELKKLDRLNEVGGHSYIVSLAQFAGTSAHVEEYCNTVRTHAYARQQISLSQTYCEDLLNKKNDPFTITERFQQNQLKLAKEYSRDDKVSIGGVLNGSLSRNGNIPFVEILKQRHEYCQANGKPFSTGIPTGFVDLDSKAILLEDTHLVVVAGRPSMGKTTFAMNIAENVCLEQGLPVATFSLEMSADQLAERVISSQAEISLLKMKQGTFTSKEFKKLQVTIDKVQSAPFYIYDQGVSTIANIVSKARQLKDKEDIRLIIIDYLQLLGVDGGSDSRQYEVAEVSRRLKMLAMELRVPILCVAQLSRKVEERSDKRPLLSDLRDSGQIEQDADAVAFLYRRDYYNKTDHPGQAEIIIAKNRHGPTATACLSFLQENGRFGNLSSMSAQRFSIPVGTNEY